ncbi:MAG: DegV family protein [Chitinophagales bacterium]
MTVKIVTDSTADLPESLVRKYGVTVVPLNVHFGDEVYQDGVDIWASEFYYKLQNGSSLPKTSQPSPGDFLKVYLELTDDGSEVASLHLSKQFSGTWQSAQMAEEMLEGKGRVAVIDSASASMGLGLIVLDAARRAAGGASLEEVAAAAQRASERLSLYFVVDTLEWLQKNGRIGRAAAFLGSVLNLKPVLTVENGIVAPVDKVRGKGKAVARMFELTRQRVGERPSRLSVLHADRPEEAAELAEQARREFNCVEAPIISEVGPIVGTHVGPGTLGLIGLPEE